jgi:thiamine pyrophosphate-dependent acetolactate synthase large subunit-like protein
MTSDKDNDRISELVANHTTYNFSNEIVKFQKNKNLIALSDNSWSVFSVVQTINEFITEFHVCFDVGSFATIVENYILPINTLRIHSSFVGKFMGSAVPISIGVSMAEPDVPVLCLLGEGSYASSTSELVTIAQMQLPICLILLSDGSMHSITGQATSQRQHLGALLPPNLTTIKRMRFPDIPSYVIKSRTELTNKLLEWNRKFPILLILEFDPEKYAKNVSLLR